MRSAGCCVLVLPLLLSGCADRERIAVPTDPAGFTDRGWDFFSEGDLEQALGDFQRAIDQDPDFGPAYVGLGWARLRLATTPDAMETAISSFDSATSRGMSGPEVLAGKAAAQLGIGSAPSRSSAIALAQSARNQAPGFQFEHQTSFDATDLFLIEAFALAAEGNVAAALSVADAASVGDSGIVQANESTWVVDGTTFSTFEGAALRFLHKLSEEHAG